MFIAARYPQRQLQQPPRAYIPQRAHSPILPTFRTQEPLPSPIINYDRSPNYAESSATRSAFFDSDVKPDPAVDNSRSSLIAVAV
jgi:hypothetical protein